MSYGFDYGSLTPDELSIFSKKIIQPTKISELSLIRFAKSSPSDSETVPVRTVTVRGQKEYSSIEFNFEVDPENREKSFSLRRSIDGKDPANYLNFFIRAVHLLGEIEFTCDLNDVFLSKNFNLRNENSRYATSRDPGIGAFEILVRWKEKDGWQTKPLYSKLKTKQWPNFKILVEKIIDDFGIRRLPAGDIKVPCCVLCWEKGDNYAGQ